MTDLDNLRYITITLANGQTFTLTLDAARVNAPESTLEAECKYRVTAKSTWTADIIEP